MKKLPLVIVLGLSLNCQAQSPGDFLKNAAADAARQAVAGNVRQAVTGAVDAAAKSLTQPGAANAPAAAATLAAAPVRAVAPPGCAKVYGTPLALGARPANYQLETLWPDTACPVSNYGDLKFEKAIAAKHAFVEASKVRCKDSEGGYWPDAWGWRELVRDSGGGDYVDEFAKMLVALKEGESLAWKGNKYDGKVTATGAHPIGGAAVQAVPLRAVGTGKAGRGIRQPVMRIQGTVFVHGLLAREGLSADYQLSLPVSICQYITQSARNENQGWEKEAGRFFS